MNGHHGQVIDPTSVAIEPASDMGHPNWLAGEEAHEGGGWEVGGEEAGGVGEGI